MKTIASIIHRYDLKRGDTMRDISGEPIANSVVYDADTCVSINTDRPLVEVDGRFSTDPALVSSVSDLLRADEVHSVLVDGKPTTQHRTIAGAVRSAVDHMRSCMERTGSLPLDDDDLRLVGAVLTDERRLDLQVRAGLIDAVPGMTPERITLLAMRISREYRIATNALLD